MPLCKGMIFRFTRTRNIKITQDGGVPILSLIKFKEVSVKKQISNLSASQNGKVFGVLMALSSLVFVVPMAIMFSFFPFGVDQNGNPVEGPPVLMFLLFPIFYLVFGYLMVAIGCKFYNFMFKYIGGVEYESRDEQA